MPAISLAGLIDEIQARAVGPARLLIGIAGPPGAGKSTLADTLAARLGPSAAVLPMDGYHRDNAELRAMGLLARKGAPETFDAEAFIAMVAALRRHDSVTYPTFDRAADATVPGGGRIGPDTRIVLIEGNYLLLSHSPWSDLAGLFDLGVYLEVGRDELAARLIARWRHYGLSAKDAQARAMGNDMRNVVLVQENARPADFTLSGW